MRNLIQKHSIDTEERLSRGEFSNTSDVVLDMNNTISFSFSKKEDKNISYLDILNDIDDLWAKP